MRLVSFRRLSVLILTGSASVLALNAHAQAAPFNPAGLAPAVLFPVTDAASAAMVRSVATMTRHPVANLSIPSTSDPFAFDTSSLLTETDDVADTLGGVSFSTT